MFGKFFRNLFRSKSGQKIARQPVGDIFPWPKNTTLMPLERLTLAVPAEILEPDQPIGSCIICDDDVEIAIPEGDDKIYLRLQTGMKISLCKSVQAIVLPWAEGETNPKRIQIISSPDLDI